MSDLPYYTRRIAENIRELRQQRKMKAADLARASGLTQSTISRIERMAKDGSNLPEDGFSMKTLNQIAKGLDLPITGVLCLPDGILETRNQFLERQNEKLTEDLTCANKKLVEILEQLLGKNND